MGQVSGEAEHSEYFLHLFTLCFLHLIGGKVIAEYEGTGVELRVNKSQERRARERGNKEHLKGLMNNIERSTEFGDHGL